MAVKPHNLGQESPEYAQLRRLEKAVQLRIRYRFLLSAPNILAMRLGIFGGSFDPVHYGHLLLAECCRDQCNLEQVWFIPAAMPPHKQTTTLTAPAHRVEMLRLATGGQESFDVSTIELDRGGLSYTVDTLATIHAGQPASELFLLLGADSLADLPNWREPARICELATPVVVRRPGATEPNFEVLAPLVPAERLDSIRRRHVEMPAIGLSASEIRHCIAEGHSIRYRTPRAVERYIQTHGLYRERGSIVESGSAIDIQ